MTPFIRSVFGIVPYFASAPAVCRRERRKAEQTLVCEVANSPFFQRMSEGKKLLNYLHIFTVGNTPFFRLFIVKYILETAAFFVLFFAALRRKLNLNIVSRLRRVSR